MNTTPQDMTVEQFAHLNHCYFRLEAGYVWGKGLGKEQSNKFFDEAEDLIRKAGFDIIKRGDINSINACPRGFTSDGDNSVYCHPMDISGYMTKEMAATVLNLVKNGGYKTFTLRTMDVYDVREHDLSSIKHAQETKARIIEKQSA